MTDDPARALLHPEARTEWIRLRTLVLIRWLAILGQLAAVAVARGALGLEIPLGPVAIGIGAAVVVNLVSTAIFPENKRLTEAEAFVTLLFDIAQLSFMLYVTGGLNNPFALLILAPVTISATTLGLRSTLILAASAIALVTLLALRHLPLTTRTGAVLELPPLFLGGFWAAIVIGILFLAAFARRVSLEVWSMNRALAATQLALAREQKLTDLGGVVAAAAHELGTPLATIKLVARELAQELQDPDLQADAELLVEQADRCRNILRSMGRTGKDDLLVRHEPLAALVHEAAEPHEDRGKTIHYHVAPSPGCEDSPQPMVPRAPEIIHGLRNFMQNAVDFADSTVWIDVEWSDREIRVRIADDGPGFPPELVGQLGDPFLRPRQRATDRARRPGYEGMGLGTFIAKTLLERTGARVAFANGSDPFLNAGEHPTRKGAIVEVVWPRERLEVPQATHRGALGENPPLR